MRIAVDVGVLEERVGQNTYWRARACRVLAAATTGPGHLDLAFREPLGPTADDWLVPMTGRNDGGPWTWLVPPVLSPVADDLPARPVVVLGAADRPGPGRPAPDHRPGLAGRGGAAGRRAARCS